MLTLILCYAGGMTEMGKPQVKAAIWARVSTADQHTENQVSELRALAVTRGYQVTAEITTEDSAWASGTNGNGTKGKEFDARRAELLEGARLGKYEVILVWGLDRLSRRGAEDMLAYTRKLADTGARLVSIKDPWAEDLSSPMVRELLLGIFATIARFESERRSERIRAGLARRRAEGKPVGRIKGSGDKKPRRRSGYVAAWEQGGARREAERPAEQPPTPAPAPSPVRQPEARPEPQNASQTPTQAAPAPCGNAQAHPGHYFRGGSGLIRCPGRDC